MSEHFPADQRASPRLPCSDVVVVRLIGERCACIVQDRSDSGMCLDFGAPRHLDPSFVVELSKDQHLIVHVVWTRGARAGVRIDKQKSSFSKK